MTELINHYVDQHTAAAAAFAGKDLGWLSQQRQNAIAEFKRVGFPSQRDEDWRYTSLQPVASKLLQVKVDRNPDANPAKVELESHLIAGLDSYRMIFIDGLYMPEISTIQQASNQIHVGSLTQLLESDPGLVAATMTGADLSATHGLAALNLAFSNAGYVIEVSANTKLDKPIELVFISVGDNLAVQPRSSVKLGQHAEATVIERYVSAANAASMVNSTCQISLDDGARLDFYLLQNQGNSAFQVSTVGAELGRDSWLKCRTITLGGALVRNNIKALLNQPGAHCDLLGLYNISAKQHVDNHTTIVHVAARCTSRELYKGVLDQRARAVFHGRIKVEPKAQKTDATQTNNNLLLSANAEIDTKPQLEIYADDVKCAHGATVGQIDQAALLYLRSRGIGEHDARLLLTYAFLSDVLSEVAIEPLRQSLEAQLGEKFFEKN